MNPFHVLKTVQEDYRKYVESFQLIKSADIPPLLADAIDQGELLWKDPYVQISRRFQPGGPLTDLIQNGMLHADCARVFYRDENDARSPPIALHSHQRRSVEAAARGENYLVSTRPRAGGRQRASPPLDAGDRPEQTQRTAVRRLYPSGARHGQGRRIPGSTEGASRVEQQGHGKDRPDTMSQLRRTQETLCRH